MAIKVNSEVRFSWYYLSVGCVLYYAWQKGTGDVTKLGNYVKGRRDQLGWSRADLARESEVPHTTIRNIENNPHDVKPKEETIEALAKAFKEDPVTMKILAGYSTVVNGDVSTFAQRIDALRKSSPRWEKALDAIQNDMTPEEQGQALTALEIHVEQVRRRRKAGH